MDYDASNRIRKVTDGSNQVVGEYYYDDQGFRVRKVSRRTVAGEDRQIEVLYPSMYFGIEKQYTTGGTEIEESHCAVNNVYLNGVRVAVVAPSGQALYYLTDQVDSVKVVVNDSGLPIKRFEYLPYGETWFEEGEGSHAPKYNSQELDLETGYYFYNARHYDPEISRFVTADNVIDGEFDTQGWNRYSYTKGNPIIYKDPTGHFIPLLALVAGAVSVASLVLSNLAPLNDKEYEHLDPANEKKDKENIKRKNMSVEASKDKVIEGSATEGVDQTTKFIRDDKAATKIIKGGLEKEKKLITDNDASYHNLAKNRKQMYSEIDKVKATPAKKTIFSKALGPALDLYSIWSAHSDSDEYCREEGKKWDQAVNERKKEEKDRGRRVENKK